MGIITQLKKLFQKKPKIVVIAGPTSAGKSDLAVDIAKEIGGEIISADSRQVYKGLDLASGKITAPEMRGVPHHMIDLVHPSTNYSVSDYVREATIRIADLHHRRKIPIICGGTGFYINALINGVQFHNVPANQTLRTQLENESTEFLFALLQQRAPKRALEIGPYNKQRIIRALEIFEALGKIPKTKNRPRYRSLCLCIDRDPHEMHKRIQKRIIQRLDAGMLAEIQRLLDSSISHERLEELGLECRYLSRHLRGLLDRDKMIKELAYKTKQFAKRQRTWFKKNNRYLWRHPERDREQIMNEITNFLFNDIS